MSRRKVDPVAALVAKIESKRGYIRYLRNRTNDPTPIQQEIARHEAIILEHMARVESLQALLKDLPSALSKAEGELLELLKLEQEHQEAINPEKATKSALEQRIALLQIALRKLEISEDAEPNS